MSETRIMVASRTGSAVNSSRRWPDTDRKGADQQVRIGDDDVADVLDDVVTKW